MSDLRELSLRLNDVLEMVGVTEEMRKYHRQRATIWEIISMIHFKRRIAEVMNVYQCGSNWEGTVTPDLASDVDTIRCPSKLLVVQDRLLAGPGWFLLIVRDEWTRPGYVKLQHMRDCRPLTVHDEDESIAVVFDGEGRACMNHLTEGTIQGPSQIFVNELGKHAQDHVLAYRCRDIPRFATDWISRPRLYDWPSKQLIDELKIMGCLFVGVGHYESRDKELEWRLSFSLQERMLMKSLNITQHRVYVILKMIKRNILERRLNEESLTSYHCKTCVFYMAESTPVNMWVPQNIISCLLQCLTLLSQWIKDKYCPSFFMKDSNLFDKEGFLKLTGPLEILITSLLQMGHQFLYELHSDHVGEMLRDGNLILFKSISDSSFDKYVFETNRTAVCGIASVFRTAPTPYNLTQDSLSLNMSELEELQHGNSVPGYSQEEYKDVIRHVLPWLHLSIGLEYAARAVTCQDKQEGKKPIEKADCHMLEKKADYHLQQARNTDLVNVRLAQATILLRLEQLEECFLLLQELENCWTYRVVTDCPCTQRGVWVYRDEEKYCEIAAECRHMSLSKLMRTRYAFCVFFERSLVKLVPYPLRYEMYRSLYTRSGSRDEDDDDVVIDDDDDDDAWFDLAAVKAMVHQYLLNEGDNDDHDDEEGKKDEDEDEDNCDYNDVYIDYDDDYFDDDSADYADEWFDVAAVDAKVYFYLLQYLVCSKLNREPHKQIAIDKLASITLHDIQNELSHRETAFNLLGWVYLQEHRVADAMWCFLQSWQIRPDHNAAKFHVVMESYKMARVRQNNDTARQLILFSDAGRFGLPTSRITA